jgi:hypothetical protein
MYNIDKKGKIKLIDMHDAGLSWPEEKSGVELPWSRELGQAHGPTCRVLA